MTQLEIFCNYVAAKRKASELENIARKLKAMASSNLNSVISDLDKNWDGDASREFIKKAGKLTGKINSRAESLKKDADTIRRIAERTYQAEMEALKLSQQRNY